MHSPDRRRLGQPVEIESRGSTGEEFTSDMTSVMTSDMTCDMTSDMTSDVTCDMTSFDKGNAFTHNFYPGWKKKQLAGYKPLYYIQQKNGNR